MSVVDPVAGAVERIMRFPVNALEYTNILLTTDDAVVGATPREVIYAGEIGEEVRDMSAAHAVFVVVAAISLPALHQIAGAIAI